MRRRLTLGMLPSENDPFRDYEKILRALQGPVARVVRNQAALQRTLGPTVLGVLEQQQRMRAVMQAPALQGIETQRAVERALRGPAALVREQEQMRLALAAPILQVQRNLEVLRRGVLGPYAGILQAQASIIDAVEYLAEARPIDVGAAVADDVDAETVAWLENWRQALEAWSPTAREARALVDAMTFLVALILFSEEATALHVPSVVISAAGALLAGTVLLIRFLPPGDDE
jgi:hypothetical protein